MDSTAPDYRLSQPPDAAALSALQAADLQDHLMTANHDLERLQRLLADTCDALLARFHAALQQLDPLAAPQPPRPAEARAAAQAARAELAAAVVALQFQDMSSQLINHTQQRLRNCADQLARDAFGPDADGESVVVPAPLRPNPVTQDEMDAGSIELF